MLSRTSLVFFVALAGSAPTFGQATPTPTPIPSPTAKKAVTLDLTIPEPTPLATPVPTAKPTPTKASAPAAATTDPKTEKEEISTIAGLTLNRSDGRFLGVEMQGIQMKVTFYDAKKKKIAGDAQRIIARWRDVGKDRNTVLRPSSPEVFVSPGLLRKPHDYRVTLVLMGAEDAVLETFHVNLLALPKGTES